MAHHFRKFTPWLRAQGPGVGWSWEVMEEGHGELASGKGALAFPMETQAG